MARPALSAARALEIIDLMAASPKQAFTMSELVQQTGTNIASMHAILAVLVQHGHLTRHPTHKTYRLAPALFAIGEAMAQHDPLLTSSRAAAGGLAEATGQEVVLTGRAGEDIICLARFASSRTPQFSMRVGERVPLRPPLGGTFCAWMSEEEIDQWLARRGPGDSSPELDVQDRASLQIVRDRGYIVVAKSPPQQALGTAFALAGRESALEPRQVDALIADLYGGGSYQIHDIVPELSYDLSAISAPIFDAHGQAIYALSLGGHRTAITGAEVENLARQVTDACAAVMRENDVRMPGVMPERRIRQR
ncbi:IclR family transcriptional regulator [Sphingomonas montanisoli]|nr:IclR family transcriptional regulator C-terminal domain-containing protein [Sphingomonas montanisoli]